MIIARRSFLTGLGAALVAAPAIVRVQNIMPVRSIERLSRPVTAALFDPPYDAVFVLPPSMFADLMKRAEVRGYHKVARRDGGHHLFHGNVLYVEALQVRGT